jgi:hypothetical protein
LHRLFGVANLAAPVTGRSAVCVRVGRKGAGRGGATKPGAAAGLLVIRLCSARSVCLGPIVRPHCRPDEMGLGPSPMSTAWPGRRMEQASGAEKW